MNRSDNNSVKTGFDEPGIIGRAAMSYDGQNERFSGSFTPWLLRRPPLLRAVARVRRAVASSVENSFIVKTISGLAGRLPGVSMRAYGTFLLSTGLYIAVIYVIKSVSSTLYSDIDDLITSAMLLLLSIPLLASGKTLAEAVCTSRTASFIAFDMLGYRPEVAQANKTAYRRCDIALIAGMIAGLLSFYFDPLVIVLTICAAACLYIILTKPEAGVILLYALFPLFDTSLLAPYITYVSACYLIKLICGRRTLKLDLADTVMLIFSLSLCFGGIVNYGGGHGTVYFSYISVYFLACVLLRSDKWRKRCRRALVSGGAAAAVILILGRFTGRADSLLASVDSDVLYGVMSYVNNITQNANGVAVYLAMTLPVMIASVLNRRDSSTPLRMILFSAVTVAAIIYTLSRGIWLGAAVGIIMLLIMINVKFILLPAGGICVATAAVLLLPDSAGGYIMRLLDMTGEATVSRITVRRNSMRIFLDNILGGIGSGDGVFTSIYDNYSHIGDMATDSQSLYLQIGVELGLAGLIAFIAAVALIIMKAASNAGRATDICVKRNAYAGIAGIVAALTCGMTSYIWADPEMLLLFYMFAAFVSLYNTGDAAAASEDGTAATAGFATAEITYK